jgi:hypothetical protein
MTLPTNTPTTASKNAITEIAIAAM